MLRTHRSCDAVQLVTSPMSVVDNLIEGPPVRFADGLQRAVRGIADAEQVRHLVTVGDAEDGARLVLIPHRRVASAQCE